MRTIRRTWEHLAQSALLAAFAAALGACAHDPNLNLVLAEQQFRAAETDPLVAANAPLQLEDARVTLERGQRAWQNGEDEDEVDRLAYLAAQRVDVARLSAQRRADVERADELSARRDPLVAVAPLTPVPASPQSSQSIVEDVFFEPERASVPETSRLELALAADEIVAHPDPWVRVEGHADDTERYPLQLSEERAASVASELIALGVDPDRLLVRGYGTEASPASSITPSGRQRNRRVEIVLTPLVGMR